MAEHSLKATPPNRKGKAATPGSWKPGISGNPGGRPRRALAAVEAVREKVDPNEWVAAELATARDLDKPWDVRRDAWRALIDRGFVRAPAQLDARISQEDAADEEFDFSKLTVEQHRQLVELQDLARAPKGDQPFQDDEQPLAIAGETTPDPLARAQGVTTNEGAMTTDRGSTNGNR